MRGDGGLHLLAARIGGALGELRLKLRRFLLALCAQLSKNERMRSVAARVTFAMDA
jgi:hypothetical protein